MGQILQNWRILIAGTFSAVLIIGSFMLARGVESPSVAQASTETALLQSIAAKDSDGDGLPDWEETLYGTDPHVVDTFHLGMTDGEAVAKGLIVPKAVADIRVVTSTPATNTDINYSAAGLTAPTEGSLTDAFAKNFFTLYLSTKSANGGADLTSDQTNTLATQAMSQFLQNLAPVADFKIMKDIKVSGTGPDALRAYAAAAEAVVAAYDPHLPKSQMQYLQEYVNGNDQSALDGLRTIATSFRETATGLAIIAVPSEMAVTHLALVNALARVGGQINDFSRVDTDPLEAMFALDRHLQAVIDVANAFTGVAGEFATEGVVLTPGEKGATFVNTIRTMKANSSSQKL